MGENKEVKLAGRRSSASKGHGKPLEKGFGFFSQVFLEKIGLLQAELAFGDGREGDGERGWSGVRIDLKTEMFSTLGPVDIDSRLIVIACANAIAFGLFSWDKGMSKWKKRRIPESTLLAVTLFGGEVGAICAMLLVRHKTRKRAFLWKFWPCFAAGVALSVFFLKA